MLLDGRAVRDAAREALAWLCSAVGPRVVEKSAVILWETLHEGLGMEPHECQKIIEEM